MRFFSLTGAGVGRSITLVGFHRETRFLGCHSEGSSDEKSLSATRAHRGGGMYSKICLPGSQWKVGCSAGSLGHINPVRFAGPAEARNLLISGTSLDVWLASPMK